MKGPTNSSARPNIRLMNQEVTFVANTDSETNVAFPYRASIEDDRINEYMCATVIFSPIQSSSGMFADFCQTYDGGVYIYAKTDAGTITIPAVSCDIAVNYVNMDDTPTSGNNIPITSDGVYDALNNGSVTKLGTSSIGTNTKPIILVDGEPTPVANALLSSLPTGDSQKVTGRLYFPSFATIIGSVRDNARSDMKLDAYNPNNNYIARLVLTMRDDNTAQLILEKWSASIDANGNPYGATYISGTSIGTLS